MTHRSWCEANDADLVMSAEEELHSSSTNLAEPEKVQEGKQRGHDQQGYANRPVYLPQLGPAIVIDHNRTLLQQ